MAFQFTLADFLADTHGKPYARVVNAHQRFFEDCCRFFNDVNVQASMVTAVTANPTVAPLEAVVTTLEANPWFDRFFMARTADATFRTRQTIGVMVKFVMAHHGITPRRRQDAKGKWRAITRSLGTRDKAAMQANTSGVPYNKTGSASKWFSRCAIYG